MTWDQNIVHCPKSLYLTAKIRTSPLLQPGSSLFWGCTPATGFLET
eukprot:CAMPEP_0202103184 /NCGR_PEP_ID=MMETSP0965-20130614/4742_1 /ASSEMBLY_ACC=CAM_ASM_000507 /TAXON_ID=4773 /ORGANISM="Schizochytrium aggregatum, Strain ATCC28209" /LENGTH=45 /DNA_ID= /DNA_START= /DNA_END= /DNA_ORIENTATION=